MAPARLGVEQESLRKEVGVLGRRCGVASDVGSYVGIARRNSIYNAHGLCAWFRVADIPLSRLALCGLANHFKRSTLTT